MFSVLCKRYDVMSEFKVIKYKKRSKKSKEINITSKFLNTHSESEVCIIDSLVKRINSAKEDIENSSFLSQLIQNLGQSGKELQNIDIVSFGLGQFSQCVSSRFQFAFLLFLKENFKAQVYVFDPAFSLDEIAILKHFNCKVIEINEEGKRRVKQDTIFFLPHCPKQLINNLLWKNWGENLNKCIVIGNSLDTIVQSNSDRFLEDNLLYVFHASSFVTEIKINNCFKFSDIFNDLSLHFFLEKDINRVDTTVLKLNIEPVYLEENIEFVQNCLENTKIVDK